MLHQVCRELQPVNNTDQMQSQIHIFDYYRVNMCLPFLDHIINGIDVYFDKYGKIVLAMAGLVPSVIHENDV